MAVVPERIAFMKIDIFTIYLCHITSLKIIEKTKQKNSACMKFEMPLLKTWRQQFAPFHMQWPEKFSLITFWIDRVYTT